MWLHAQLACAYMYDRIPQEAVALNTKLSIINRAANRGQPTWNISWAGGAAGSSHLRRPQRAPPEGRSKHRGCCLDLILCCVKSCDHPNANPSGQCTIPPNGAHRLAKSICRRVPF